MAQQQRPKLVNPAYIVSTSEIPGYEIVQVLGAVRGISVFEAPRPVGIGFMAAKQTIDHETERRNFNNGLDASFHELSAQASGRGANAIVGVRYSTSTHNNLSGQAYRVDGVEKKIPIMVIEEVCAYGTAVIIAPKRQ
ncbi:UNVERIFIED_CONTAM: hypothetical protein HDU68_008119 [Siphonaria sp. JEL0065]|nr:hypothetical protein HDU68_008119 [Siphonaria sp. JEL0065]